MKSDLELDTHVTRLQAYKMYMHMFKWDNALHGKRKLVWIGKWAFFLRIEFPNFSGLAFGFLGVCLYRESLNFMHKLYCTPPTSINDCGQKSIALCLVLVLIGYVPRLQNGEYNSVCHYYLVCMYKLRKDKWHIKTGPSFSKLHDKEKSHPFLGLINNKQRLFGVLEYWMGI